MIPAPVQPIYMTAPPPFAPPRRGHQFEVRNLGGRTAPPVRSWRDPVARGPAARSSAASAQSVLVVSAERIAYFTLA